MLALPDHRHTAEYLMANSLLQTAHQYTQTHSDREGIARTTVPGLVLIRSTRPTELEHAIVRPLLCLVLQGCKQVSMGNSDCSFGADETMLVTSNQPTVSRIISASPSKPYLSIALDLDPSIIAELNLASTQTPGSSALQHDASLELREAVRRLLQLLEQPHSLAVLQSALLREIHHWLLLGPQGAAVRNLGMPDSQVQRIARAVALLRENYKQRLTVERLAVAAGMGRSAFHQHFRAVTSLSPLQFQKQLRLIEARRLLLNTGQSISTVAFKVGYESISQFTREYRRMFNLPPRQDRQAAHIRAE